MCKITRLFLTKHWQFICHVGLYHNQDINDIVTLHCGCVHIQRGNNYSCTRTTSTLKGEKNPHITAIRAFAITIRTQNMYLFQKCDFPSFQMFYFLHFSYTTATKNKRRKITTIINYFMAAIRTTWKLCVCNVGLMVHQ